MSAHDAAAAYDHRYTDRDVREDPRLAELAWAYATVYGGDFEPLVEARMWTNSDLGPMPTALTRRVLNCMRHDFAVAADMPAPRRPALHLVDSAPSPPRRRRAAPEPPPRYPFDLRTTWHRRYLESTAIHASVTHILDAEKSTIRYFPSGAYGRFQCRARPLCPGPSGSGIRLVDEPSPERRPCKTCARVERERAERAR